MELNVAQIFCIIEGDDTKSVGDISQAGSRYWFDDKWTSYYWVQWRMR